MQKDTKTYRCDGCDKTKVFDFYDSSNAAQMETVTKELASWVVLKISGHQAGKEPVIPDTVGHACSKDCVKQAIANIVKRKMPE
jgi:hypothetical protein